jgi:hypothetical protein
VRLAYLAVPAGLAAWCAFVFALFVWPVWTSLGLLAALFVVSIFCALFVWPYEDESR